ncbi:MAG: hypothetical protein HN995_00015 [Candidatus Marinimicrobia bacterium]|nr:hypothetical protein [Candidatus Neomarinimicrobiota bacterium]
MTAGQVFVICNWKQKKQIEKKLGNATPDQEIEPLPSSPPSIIPEFIDETIKAGLIHNHPDVDDG